MKRTKKPLALTSETIRALSQSAMGRARGGGTKNCGGGGGGSATPTCPSFNACTQYPNSGCNLSLLCDTTNGFC